MEIWEELHGLGERGILVEVEHVKAHRTKKGKDNMSQFERFVTEGNEKEQCWMKGLWQRQERKLSFHCLVEQWKNCEELRPKPKEKWIFVDQKRGRNIEQSGVRKSIGA